MRLLSRLRGHSSLWTISGDGQSRAVRILGVWFVHERLVQKWSPLMHSRKEMRGIRVGSLSLSVTRHTRKFFDGEEPRIEKEKL